MSEQALIPVLVTTRHRGVFFGYVPEYPSKIGDGDITIRQARNCLVWSTAERGLWGLAVAGPSTDCRIGPAAPELSLESVTSIARCTPEAARRWEEAPWGAI